MNRVCRKCGKNVMYVRLAESFGEWLMLDFCQVSRGTRYAIYERKNATPVAKREGLMPGHTNHEHTCTERNSTPPALSGSGNLPFGGEV